MKWSQIDKAPFQKGYIAGLEGKTLDNCPYRLMRKRRAWMAGYRKGQWKREENKAQKNNYTRSADDIERGRKRLSELRGLLT